MTDVPRGRPRQWLGLALLLAYAALLIAASLPAQLRPGALDLWHEQANRLLAHAGIVPGQAVFSVGDDSDWRARAYCTRARTLDASGGVERLFPPEGECVVQGVRPYLPPLERALYRTLMYARRARVRIGASLAFPRDPEMIESTVARLGRYLCARPVRPVPARVQLVWYAHLLSYDTAATGRANLLLFGWDCTHDRLTELRWEPGDSETVAFWGGEPWADD